MNKVVASALGIAASVAAARGIKAAARRYPEQAYKVDMVLRGVREEIKSLESVSLTRPVSWISPLLNINIGGAVSVRELKDAREDQAIDAIAKSRVVLRSKTGREYLNILKFSSSGLCIARDLLIHSYAELYKNLSSKKVDCQRVDVGEYEGYLWECKEDENSSLFFVFTQEKAIGPGGNVSSIPAPVCVLSPAKRSKHDRSVSFHNPNSITPFHPSALSLLGWGYPETSRMCKMYLSGSVYDERVELSLSLQQLAPRPFIGSNGEKLVAHWERMRAERIRYNVMLYGMPGCGKTTLFYHWAYTHKVRVAVLSGVDFSVAHNVRQLFDLGLEALLIEDVDRMKDEDVAILVHYLEHKWRESSDELPMIFISCNHPEKLPDAIYRPGRLDQMVEVSKPPSHEWPQLIRSLCERCGIDADEVIRLRGDRCEEVLRLNTVAHLESYVQRLALFGVNYEEEDCDKTFSPPVKWSGQ